MCESVKIKNLWPGHLRGRDARGRELLNAIRDVVTEDGLRMFGVQITVHPTRSMKSRGNSQLVCSTLTTRSVHMSGEEW